MIFDRDFGAVALIALNFWDFYIKTFYVVVNLLHKYLFHCSIFLPI